MTGRLRRCALVRRAEAVTVRSACGRSVFGCRGGAGFTLLEMMIVLAIIGILLSVAIPNLQQARVRANESAAMAALRALHAAQTNVSRGRLRPRRCARLRGGPA
ncbi:MAG: hypothetical protein KatS3mg102_0821 [Planctomycetota bacterium]|nr:MAG: hypothetical protein KatS3mg102_0821 [Planctomycetota bacterium]